MASIASIRSSVRTELGDLPENFRDSFRGTGEQDDWNLPANNILTVTVFEVLENGGIEMYAEPADYTVDKAKGVVTFNSPPQQDVKIVVEGTAAGIFSDVEIDHFIDNAVALHLTGRSKQIRYRDGHGFIKYDQTSMTLEDLPPAEDILVSLLATVEALWALSTDAATDIDVTTSEGTHIPRGQRWRQLISQIDILEDRYKTLSNALGVGLYAAETLDIRRVSKTTGRLVPLFQSREYDETGEPLRKIPVRSRRDSDPDGPPTPYWPGGWGF